MDKFIDFINNQYLQVAVLAWFIAQLIKVLTVLVKYKKFDFRRFVGSGGMPSSHSAFVSSIAVAVGEVEGYDSVMFAFAIVVALVTMYDASGIRRAAGKQAKVLNKIVDELESNNLKFDERLKELLGHTPVEVFAGALLGIVISLVKFL